jgi:hypothetical protein
MKTIFACLIAFVTGALNFKAILRAPLSVLMGMGAVPTNTMTTFALTGNREDISDEISIITPIDSPFYHSIGSAPVTAMKHDFMTDTIRAPGSNKALIGSDPTISAAQQPVKLSNYVQLQEESFSIADSAEAVTTVGGSGGYDYQKALKMKALVGDIEYAFLREVASVGAAGTAPSMKGLLNWLTTNLSKDAAATLNADGTVTGGANRALTAVLFQTVMQAIYASGGGGSGKTLTAYMPSLQKVVFDTFSAGTNLRRDVVKNTVDDRIDLYVTSWGTIKAEIHRTMPAGVVAIFDPAFFKKCTLVPIGVEQLAISSRSNKKFHMTVQHTLESRNELSGGRITNLT